MMGMHGAGPDSTAAAKTRHADVNIFTVASGLLYERFASIMILSVLKHTNSSVKFWFIVSQICIKSVFLQLRHRKTSCRLLSW